MKKTEYITMTVFNPFHPKYQRVFTDDDGNLYIRKKSGYLRINDLPCGQNLLRFTGNLRNAD